MKDPDEKDLSHPPEGAAAPDLLGFESTEQALHILMEKSSPPKTRMNAILQVTENLRVEEFELFCTLLEDPDEHPDVRSAVALMLGKLGSYANEADAPYLQRLTDLLIKHAHDENVTVRNYSIQALGLLGREEAIATLLNALSDENNEIFHSAAEALGKIGRPAVPHLVNLLETGADDARCIAAWKLGELRYVDAIPKLIQVIEDDHNTELLALCVWALGEIGFGPKEVLDILNWAKAHEAPDVHRRANLAIKKIARHCN